MPIDMSAVTTGPIGINADLLKKRAANAPLNFRVSPQLAPGFAALMRQGSLKSALGMGEPYRRMGMEALPILTGSLETGGPLDTLRSSITRDFMSKYLQKAGFDPTVSGAVASDTLSRTLAEESTARRGRALDLMSLGMGETASGMGLAGQAGTSQARNIMASAAAQTNLLAERDAARAAELGYGLYGGQRLLSDYIARKEAEKYGGY